MATCMHVCVFLRQSMTNRYDRNGPGGDNSKPVRNTEYITVLRVDILFIFGK